MVYRKAGSLIVSILLLGNAGTAVASHLSEREVESLEAACAAQREAKLGPERLAIVERCMREEDMDQAACAEKYKNYGEVTTGAIRRVGKYHDTPECREAYEARKHYNLNPGR